MRIVNEVHKFQCVVGCLIMYVCPHEYFTLKGILMNSGIGSLQ